MERNDPAWWALKEAASRRGRFRCEFCQLRPISDLHHRTYEHEGQEKLNDVMAVCRPCHRLIHGLQNEIVVKKGSLADLGDTGKGLGELWLEYFRQQSEEA